MRLKLDENLGRSLVAVLTAAGHDVATVLAQGMAGATDAALFEVCRAERRALVTLDLDFANPQRFDPASGFGVAVLRVADSPRNADLLRTASTLVDALARTDITGRLWIVDRQRVREYDAGGG